MNVAQRSTSETGKGDADGYFTCDRWNIDVGVSGDASAGRFTMSQDSSAPSGFANSLKLACTTADTSIASGERLQLQQLIEGQNLQAFAKGTSDAKPFAVSFYVKGNASATYVCELFDLDNTRQCSKTFNVTTDWTRVKLTFPADTTGTFDDDNAASLMINIFLHAGSGRTSGTLNSSGFASSTTANRAVGISSFFDSTDRTFFITGVQLEVGQNATSFEVEPFERTLAKCQRYFYIKGGTNYAMYGQGRATSTTRVRGILQHLATMRSAPSFSATNVSDISVEGNAVSSISTDQATTINIALHADVSSGLTTGQIYRVYDDGASNSRVSFDSEL